jgi:hypothetical protein
MVITDHVTHTLRVRVWRLLDPHQAEQAQPISPAISFGACLGLRLVGKIFGEMIL